MFIIDGIGPFFVGRGRARTNWSKIPFSDLETASGLDPDRVEAVETAFRAFVERVGAIGYDTVTLDDVAHLSRSDLHPPALTAKIEAYRALYRRLFAMCAEQGLRVLVTTDVMYYTPQIERAIGRGVRRASAFLADTFDRLFADFPGIHGVILRIGESDGVDVSGDFRSRLLLRYPRQVRRLLRTVLPVFEAHGRECIFRTWSVGAYRVGDLIWNRDTFHATFDRIHSPSLIISMKYGESDFFRYLPLNKLFFRSSHRKIVELQARREYEGFGEYPSFIGWDYQDYRDQLARAENVVGISVWCQTGGWTIFDRLTFVENSSIWNEINTFVSIALFRDGITTEDAIRRFCAQRLPESDPSAVIRLLRLSDEVIKELLYMEPFASQKRFFRRLRLPTILSVFWDNILITHSMRKLLSCLLPDGEATVAQGYRALEKIDDMMEIAATNGLPVEDLQFQRDTFEILAVAREYYFGRFEPGIVDRLERLKRRYKATHPRRYGVRLDFTPVRFRRYQLRWAIALLIRDKRGYRLLDRLFTIHVLSRLYPLIQRFDRGVVPEFAQRQAMGFDHLFK